MHTGRCSGVCVLSLRSLVFSDDCLALFRVASFCKYISCSLELTDQMVILGKRLCEHLNDVWFEAAVVPGRQLLGPGLTALDFSFLVPEARDRKAAIIRPNVVKEVLAEGTFA